MDQNDQEEKLKIIKDCDKTKKDIAKEKYLEKGRYYKENKGRLQKMAYVGAVPCLKKKIIKKESMEKNTDKIYLKKTNK